MMVMCTWNRWDSKKPPIAYRLSPIAYRRLMATALFVQVLFRYEPRAAEQLLQQEPKAESAHACTSMSYSIYCILYTTVCSNRSNREQTDHYLIWMSTLSLHYHYWPASAVSESTVSVSTISVTGDTTTASFAIFQYKSTSWRPSWQLAFWQLVSCPYP